MTIDDFDKICDTFTNKQLFKKDEQGNIIKNNKKPVLLNEII